MGLVNNLCNHVKRSIKELAWEVKWRGRSFHHGRLRLSGEGDHVYFQFYSCFHLMDSTLQLTNQWWLAPSGHVQYLHGLITLVSLLSYYRSLCLLWRKCKIFMWSRNRESPLYSSHLCDKGSILHLLMDIRDIARLKSPSETWCGLNWIIHDEWMALRAVT